MKLGLKKIYVICLKSHSVSDRGYVTYDLTNWFWGVSGVKYSSPADSWKWPEREISAKGIVLRVISKKVIIEAEREKQIIMRETISEVK